MFVKITCVLVPPARGIMYRRSNCACIEPADMNDMVYDINSSIATLGQMLIMYRRSNCTCIEPADMNDMVYDINSSIATLSQM